MQRANGLSVPETLAEAAHPVRDCGVKSFAICGIATEIGIEPTVRQGADLGFIPIVVADACGGGHEEAAERALAGMRFMGDAVICTVDELAEVWR